MLLKRLAVLFDIKDISNIFQAEWLFHSSKRTSAIDYPMPLSRTPITLMSALPKGSTINMWVYVKVFGVVQWAIFMIFLSTLGLVMSTTNKLANEHKVNISLICLIE